MLGRRFVVLSAIALILVACGGGGERGCDDPDLDGYGPGCEAGEDDCDPRNPDRNVDCVVVPPPDCTADPTAPGCPCLRGTRRFCFDGPAEAEGVAACVAGVRVCLDRIDAWGRCDGQVRPTPERCNELDDDCDGLVDEGARSPCGGCDPDCVGAAWGDPTDPFEVVDDSGLAVTDLGILTLARDPVRPTGTVWVPSSDDQLITKIDADAQRVTAQYATAGSAPSRIAVDHDGDAWVATRSFGAQSTVMKIAGEVTRCVDGNGNDVIETSGALGDVLPAGEDECVLFEVPVGEPGAVARALAVDGSVGLDGTRGGQVWVGLHEDERVLELDAETGEVVDEVAVPGVRPYAATVDLFGTLWVASRDGQLAEIDRRLRPLAPRVRPVPFACFLTYGIATDLRGRVYLTGFSCDGVHRFDPTTEQWRFLVTPESVRGASMGGSLVDPTAQELWVAHTSGLLSRLQLEPTFRVVDTLDLAVGAVTPVESIGVSVDASGGVWVASAGGGPDGRGLATRVDPSGASPTVHLPVGEGPHVQGDMTGADLAGGFAPEGGVRRVFTGCGTAGDTRWRQVHLDAELGAAGEVTVAARHAPTADALEDAVFVVLGTAPDELGPFSISDALAPDGGVLELRVDLRTSARDGAPRVRRVGVEWRCPGPI